MINNKLPQEWLSFEDQIERENRILRLEWAIDHYPKLSLVFYHGGLITKYLFEEARYCFVYGQFVASILLSLAFIEHTLAGLFYQLPNNALGKIGVSQSRLQRAGIFDLINWALKFNWISEDDFRFIDYIREIRNPLVHPRPPSPIREDSDIEKSDELLKDWWKEKIELRSLEEDKHPYNIIEDDARKSLLIAFRVLEIVSPT
jgi:hypothetical protein